MEWLIIGGLILWFFNAIGNAIKKGDAKRRAVEEAKHRAARLAASRKAILDSGDLVAIHRLNMMEAAGPVGTRPAVAGTARAGSGPGMLGTAAAVAGGMVAGNAITGALASAELEAALADLEADFSALETAALEGDLAGGLEDEDLSFDI